MKDGSNISAPLSRPKLLSRDEFREAVFARDKHRCVICEEPAADAHHILDRRLFSEPEWLGGYLIDNGASLCARHHLEAEMTTLSVEEIRAAAMIPESRKVLPPAYYDDQPVDKWGNPILPNGLRMRGELFDDPNVQKALEQGNVLSKFTRYVKYPRTFHLPWSPGKTDDDRVLTSTDCFRGQEVVVTVKMDGENTTLYNDYLHARSTSDKKHWSKNWIKNFHGKIAHEIPFDWRLVVENLYAKHSILYRNLLSYCHGISIWDENNRCLPWDQTVQLFQMLGIVPVPVIYRGPWIENIIRALHKPMRDGDECEGYVVRVAGDFHYGEFSKSVAKFVRAGHVTENEHWFYGKAGEKNQMKEVVDEN